MHTLFLVSFVYPTISLYQNNCVLCSKKGLLLCRLVIAQLQMDKDMKIECILNTAEQTHTEAPPCVYIKNGLSPLCPLERAETPAQFSPRGGLVVLLHYSCCYSCCDARLRATCCPTPYSAPLLLFYYYCPVSFYSSIRELVAGVGSVAVSDYSLCRVTTFIHRVTSPGRLSSKASENTQENNSAHNAVQLTIGFMPEVGLLWIITRQNDHC
ncbi:hypothetical protein Ddc_07380 [Ditylenchus destructor]|nr:hypothetical protein Ddc_07380 [Ditylenchus destructor]